MKKIVILILSFALLIAGVFYWGSSRKPKPDETKTQAEPESTIQTYPAASPGKDDLIVPELEDFDQEIQDLDQSINQL